MLLLSTPRLVAAGEWLSGKSPSGPPVMNCNEWLAISG